MLASPQDAKIKEIDQGIRSVHDLLGKKANQPPKNNTDYMKGILDGLTTARNILTGQKAE